MLYIINSIKMIRYIIIIAISLISFNAYSKQLPELYTIITFKCTFDKGVMWDEKEKKLHKLNDKLILRISSVDLINNTALMVGNQGSSKVMASATNRGIHFYELTQSGNVNHTTIFRNDSYYSNSQPKIYPAVHSRHIHIHPLSGEPIPSQRYGYCKNINPNSVYDTPLKRVNRKIYCLSLINKYYDSNYFTYKCF